MARIVLHIAGMHCAACVGRARAALGAVAGVRDVCVTLTPEGLARLDADPGVQIEELKSALTALGYAVTVAERADEAPLKTSAEADVPERGARAGQTPVEAGPPAPEISPALPASAQLRFRITGMHCVNCARSIEKALRETPGVDLASVNFAAELGSVRYDSRRTGPEALFEAVRRAGYEAASLDAVDESAARRERNWLIVSAAALVPTMVVMFALHAPHLRALQAVLMGALAVGVQFTAGWTFYRGAFASLRSRMANMDVLVAMGITAALGYSVAAALGAFGRAAPMFFETSVMLIAFIRVGKYLEARMRGRARAALRALLDLRPVLAARLGDDGRESRVPLDEVGVGDRLLVRPGEKVPTDGVVLEGMTLVDESLVTGESLPTARKPGDEVVGATLNETGLITLRATRVGSETFLGQIVRMVEEAQADRPPMQRLADQVSNVFVPISVLIALVTLIVWGVAGGGEATIGRWAWAIRMATAVLVIACPCALGLATPTAFLVGSGLALRLGILVRRATALELAGRLDRIVFDKTGTLTEGRFAVTEVVPSARVEEADLLRLAAACERGSNHPIAAAIVRRAADRGLELPSPLSEVEEVPGHGVRAVVSGDRVWVGSERLVEEALVSSPGDHPQADLPLARQGRTIVHVARGAQYLGFLALADRPRPEARVAIDGLHELEVETALVTGDGRRVAEAIGRELGIPTVEAEVLPAGKRDIVERLRRGGQRVGMVGDGINDAPALAAADVGFAIGGGTDVAKEAGDIVLVRNDPRDVLRTVRIGRRMRQVIWQNLFWAFAYNVVAIPVAAGVLYPLLRLGLNPEIAGLAMALSSVTVVGNSLRLKRLRA
jgi:Cu+-exporting ATPase